LFGLVALRFEEVRRGHSIYMTRARSDVPGNLMMAGECFSQTINLIDSQKPDAVGEQQATNDQDVVSMYPI